MNAPRRLPSDFELRRDAIAELGALALLVAVSVITVFALLLYLRFTR